MLNDETIFKIFLEKTHYREKNNYYYKTDILVLFRYLKIAKSIFFSEKTYNKHSTACYMVFCLSFFTFFSFLYIIFLHSKDQHAKLSHHPYQKISPKFLYLSFSSQTKFPRPSFYLNCSIVSFYGSKTSL